MLLNYCLFGVCIVNIVGMDLDVIIGEIVLVYVVG